MAEMIVFEILSRKPSLALKRQLKQVFWRLKRLFSVVKTVVSVVKTVVLAVKTIVSAIKTIVSAVTIGKMAVWAETTVSIDSSGSEDLFYPNHQKETKAKRKRKRNENEGKRHRNEAFEFDSKCEAP